MSEVQFEITKLRNSAIMPIDLNDGSFQITGVSDYKSHHCSVDCCPEELLYKTGLYVDMPYGYCLDIDGFNGDQCVEKFRIVNDCEITFKSIYRFYTETAIITPHRLRKYEFVLKN